MCVCERCYHVMCVCEVLPCVCVRGVTMCVCERCYHTHVCEVLPHTRVPGVTTHM